MNQDASDVDRTPHRYDALLEPLLDLLKHSNASVTREYQYSAILKASSPAHIQENFDGSDFELTDEEITQIFDH